MEAVRPLNTGPEFHWQGGWHFARVAELGHALYGAVRLRCEVEAGSWLEVFIPAAEWASIVAAVTLEGDNATTYRMASGLHSVPVPPPEAKAGPA